MKHPVHYRGYKLEPCPIGIEFCHEDYDGSEDRRIGHEPNLEEAMEMIDELIEDDADLYGSEHDSWVEDQKPRHDRTIEKIRGVNVDLRDRPNQKSLATCFFDHEPSRMRTELADSLFARGFAVIFRSRPDPTKYTYE